MFHFSTKTCASCYTSSTLPPAKWRSSATTYATTRTSSTYGTTGAEWRNHLYHKHASWASKRMSFRTFSLSGRRSGANGLSPRPSQTILTRYPISLVRHPYSSPPLSGINYLTSDFRIGFLHRTIRFGHGVRNCGMLFTSSLITLNSRFSSTAYRRDLRHQTNHIPVTWHSGCSHYQSGRTKFDRLGSR